MNGIAVEGTLLQAGDADMDCDFDQLDLVQVQVAAKYLTGEPATWGEGDWDAAPVARSPTRFRRPAMASLISWTSSLPWPRGRICRGRTARTVWRRWRFRNHRHSSCSLSV